MSINNVIFEIMQRLKGQILVPYDTESDLLGVVIGIKCLKNKGVLKEGQNVSILLDKDIFVVLCIPIIL